jgi:integrase
MAILGSKPHLWLHPHTGRYYLVWQEHGITKRRSLRTKDLAEASAVLDELTQTLQDLGGQRPSAVTYTLGQAADDWLAYHQDPQRGLTSRTLSEYRTFRRQLLEVAEPSLLLGTVRARDCRLILEAMQRRFDYGSGTAKKRWYLMGRLFRWLVIDEVLLRNPMDGVPSPRVRHQRHPATSTEEFQLLVSDLEAAADAVPEPWRSRFQALRDWVEVLWLSGMRSVEACRLTWEDIDLDRMNWIIRSPDNKGGEQEPPIHDGLRNLLLRRKLLGGSGPFPRRKVMEHWLRRFKEGNPRWSGYNLHSLRHGFVTRARRSAGLDAAKALARHSSEKMSDHYNHVGLEEFREALNRM